MEQDRPGQVAVLQAAWHPEPAPGAGAPAPRTGARVATTMDPGEHGGRDEDGHRGRPPPLEGSQQRPAEQQLLHRRGTSDHRQPMSRTWPAPPASLDRPSTPLAPARRGRPAPAIGRSSSCRGDRQPHAGGHQPAAARPQPIERPDQPEVPPQRPLALALRDARSRARTMPRFWQDQRSEVEADRLVGDLVATRGRRTGGRTAKTTTTAASQPAITTSGIPQRTRARAQGRRSAIHGGSCYVRRLGRRGARATRLRGRTMADPIRGATALPRSSHESAHRPTRRRVGVPRAAPERAPAVADTRSGVRPGTSWITLPPVGPRRPARRSSSSSPASPGTTPRARS